MYLESKKNNNKLLINPKLNIRLKLYFMKLRYNIKKLNINYLLLFNLNKKCQKLEKNTNQIKLN